MEIKEDHFEEPKPIVYLEVKDERKIDICAFYQMGKCRFGDKCFNLHLGDIQQQSNKLEDNKIHVVNNKKELDGIIKKKPPLRTAGDVRKRIQWDISLPAEYFTVGYLDRFDGVVEKPFSAFTWECISTVDLDQLAIPQHRIQYFKYKGTKVWDKNEWLDSVFGSDGNEETIETIMQKTDDKLKLLNYDDDSDDDFLVVSGNSKEMCETSLALSNALMQEREELRATHFLCIKVKNEEVAMAVKSIQETVIEGDPILRSCTMPRELLHVTLAMIKCSTPESIEKVSEILTQLQDDILNLKEYNKNKNIIKAQCLSTFGSRVLYAKLELSPLFEEVVKILQQKLKDQKDVIITNHFDFVPHMTLIKVNRLVAKERRSKYINSCLYSKHLNENFGDILFDNIYFCHIEQKDEDGFYLPCHKIEF